MRTTLWKATNALALAAFLFSVAVQFNDPDPLRWVAVYGAAAIVCLLQSPAFRAKVVRRRRKRAAEPATPTPKQEVTA